MVVLIGAISTLMLGYFWSSFAAEHELPQSAQFAGAVIIGLMTALITIGFL